MSDRRARHYWLRAPALLPGMTPDEAERWVRRAPDFRQRTAAEVRYWNNQIRLARGQAQR